jgi:hypothetical protein
MIILIKLDVINYQIFVGQNVSSGKKSRRLIYTTIYWMQAKKILQVSLDKKRCKLRPWRRPRVLRVETDKTWALCGPFD